ncbi:MAG: lipopolysaccharide heptosyltransferase II [Thermodesulfobacteriota bacterium]
MEIKEIKKVLVRTPNWIGDSIICLPALEALKDLYSEAELTVLSVPRTAAIFEGHPAVSDIIEYDRYGGHAGIMGKRALARRLRDNQFDLAVLFQNAFDAAFIAWLAGIPRRAGYARDMRGLLLTNPVKVTEDIKKKHQVHYYLRVVEALGGKAPAEPVPRLYFEAGEQEEVVLFFEKYDIAKHSVLVGAAPGASYGPAKMWSADGFAEVVEKLSKEIGAVPLLFGGKDDVEAAAEVSKRIGMEHINLAGKTHLREFMTIAGRLKIFITNDSGPMHLAAAIGVPTVAVFGSTDPSLTGPLGGRVKVIKNKIDCSPCFERECPYGHYDCMKAVTPDEVYRACKELLGKKETG